MRRGCELARHYSLVLPLALLSLGACAPKGSRSITEWPAYGGHHSGDRYSALTQITPSNVGSLKIAWQFDTNEPGDARRKTSRTRSG
jgi:quinoprotein glucose dehydrogenase